MDKGAGVDRRPTTFSAAAFFSGVAGRHYLTKPELNALYFATYWMRRPEGWHESFPVGRYYRAPLVVFFNYGVDTGTVWKTAPSHEPIFWRHVHLGRQSPNREIKEVSRWGWVYYRRVKTGKTFYRPMNKAVHAHIRSTTYRADTGVRSIKAAVEYKYAETNAKMKSTMDGIIADTKNYEGHAVWKHFSRSCL